MIQPKKKTLQQELNDITFKNRDIQAISGQRQSASGRRSRSNSPSPVKISGLSGLSGLRGRLGKQVIDS